MIKNQIQFYDSNLKHLFIIIYLTHLLDLNFSLFLFIFPPLFHGSHLENPCFRLSCVEKRWIVDVLVKCHNNIVNTDRQCSYIMQFQGDISIKGCVLL